MAVESAAIPFPSELIMPLAGWLLIEEKGSSAWWVLLAGFYGALGNLLGSWVAYLISLKGGRPLLNKFGKYVLITHEEMDRADLEQRLKNAEEDREDAASDEARHTADATIALLREMLKAIA